MGQRSQGRPPSTSPQTPRYLGHLGLRVTPASRMRGLLPAALVLLLLLSLTDAARKKKKPAKKPAKVKGACVMTGPKLTATNTAKYTISGEKCPCWWDITRNDCACCKNSKTDMQCGWPMHKFCYKKSAMGCPGVCNNKYTLSGKGYPCYSDHGDLDCAWCTKEANQCEQNKVTGPQSREGSRCTSPKVKNYCASQQADCKHIPACDTNASCLFQSKVGKHGKHFQCECDKGWSGNGIKCMDPNGTLSQNPNTHVEVTLSLTSKLYESNHAAGEFSQGEGMEALLASMQETVSSCSGGDCEATYNHNEA